MTWVSHRLLTGTVVAIATHNIGAVIASVVGSVFPDRIEQWFLGSWQRHHRKTSHWWILYLLPCVVICMMFRKIYGVYPWQWNLHFQPLFLAFWFFAGCIIHILEDSICGKIPVFDPHKPKYLFPRLFYTGSFGETVFVILCVSILLKQFVF